MSEHTQTQSFNCCAFNPQHKFNQIQTITVPASKQQHKNKKIK